ncbi:MAG: hypothetical protein KJZ93_04345 [Caldilineaceae bacterium]|nr:hypothetical protein [Caldilineaceae bacterium]
MPHLRRHFFVLLIYTLAALALTWPLARHFTTHMAGNGIDDPSLGWNLWWVKQRLVDQANFDIFHVEWMFHPVEINLAFYTLTPLNGLLSIPLQAALGLTVASNLLLLSSFVLSAYGAFLLSAFLLAQARYSPPVSSLQSPVSSLPLFLATLFAGLVYAFASSKLFYAALGQYNIASSQWIPFCVLYVLRAGQSANRAAALRNGALAGLFLVFQTWAELTYASFLILFIAIHFVWLATARLRSQFTIHNSQFTILPFLLLATLFLLGLAPFLWAMLPDLRAEGDFFTSGGGFSDVFSADLAGYLVPTRLHTLWGDWVATLPFPNDVGQQIFIGYSALAVATLGVIALLRHAPKTIHNARWFWPFATLFFWWMTLGPRVRWFGQETPIPGPFALVSLLPFFSGNRYPSRYSVMVMLGVAVLAGWGAYGLLRWVGRRSPSVILRPALCTLLIALFLLEHVSLPLPLHDFRIPPLYQTLAQQGGDFALLELPTGWRNGARVLGKSDKLIMMQQWYQTAHGKRRLGGNTSRNPPYKFQYFTNAPLMGDLIALMNADEPHMQPVIDPQLDAMIARNRPIAGQLLADLGVRYVTVHEERSPPALLRFVDEALPLALIDEWRGPDWEGQPSHIRLYAVTPSIASPARELNLAVAAGNLYLAEGWSSVIAADERIRYATRPQADLLFNLPTTGSRLEIELFGPATAVAVAVNGHTLATQVLDASRNGEWVTVAIPPGVADRMVDRVSLRFAGPLTPVTSLAPGLSIVAQSAGKDVGDFAHIWVNGQDMAVGARGYNLAAVDEAGALLGSVAFDTHASPAASAELAAWIAQWPAGAYIAGAVMDEASYNVQGDAVDALASLGVSGDLRGKFRWSHAFLATMGQGPAHEQMQLLQPATVYTGAPVDSPAVSGGVGRVRIFIEE